MKKGILYSVLVYVALSMMSCGGYNTHDCTCTLDNGYSYDEYDVEENCSDLSSDAATCRNK